MNPREEALYINFNQDKSCISIGTEKGFQIYSTDPFGHLYSRDLGGGLKIAEMLFKCNVLALVGGGENPRFPNNKCVLWDDHQQKVIGELTFQSEVKGVRMKTDKIVIIIEKFIYVHNFSDFKLIDIIETCPNIKGICAFNTDPSTSVLACPEERIGFVCVHLYDLRSTTTIQAHQSMLGCLDLNAVGTRLATASEKGTLIRIYDTHDGTLLQEVRRGTEFAQIYSLAFEPSGKFIACSSDTETIHIFAIRGKGEKQKNSKSNLRFLKALVSYFDSEWSFAQAKIKDPMKKVQFGSDVNVIYVTTYNGAFYRLKFDTENGGDCQIELEDKIAIEKNE